MPNSNGARQGTRRCRHATCDPRARSSSPARAGEFVEHELDLNRRVHSLRAPSERITASELLTRRGRITRTGIVPITRTHCRQRATGSSQQVLATAALKRLGRRMMYWAVTSASLNPVRPSRSGSISPDDCRANRIAIHRDATGMCPLARSTGGRRSAEKSGLGPSSNADLAVAASMPSSRTPAGRPARP
jgi:hypothetical protein